MSHDTFLLVDHAVSAWRWTQGLFDPTVLGVMTASGYDRTFSEVVPSTASSGSVPKVPGCEGIGLDSDTLKITLPPDTGIDPGGIGKGLAADIVAEHLLTEGARGVCVNLGGDIRAAGESPEGGWSVAIAHPTNTAEIAAVIQLFDHGLATSNRTIRTWSRGGEHRHHLIDPRTSKPTGGPVAASVLAGQAWWAEVLSKVAMIGGPLAEPMIASLGGQLLSFGPTGERTSDARLKFFD